MALSTISDYRCMKIKDHPISKTLATWWRLVFPVHDESFRRFLWIASIAAFVRVLVMPFFGHIDFFSECRRIYYAYETGSLYPGSRFVTNFIEVMNFRIFAPFLAEKSSMFGMWDYSMTTASHLEYFGFLDHRAVLRVFLLLKLPYLIFDLGIGLLIYHFFTDKKSSLRGAWVWFFNPVSFFAFYIFSRYESIPLFFVMLTLLMFRQDRILWGFVALGLAMWSREIIVILVPFFLIYILRNRQFNWIRIIGGVAILGVFAGFASNVIPGILGFKSPFLGSVGSIAEMQESVRILGFQLAWYFPFVIVYTLLALGLMVGERADFRQLITVLGLFYCGFFVLVMHSVHYVSWAIVLFALIAAEDKQFLKGFVWFCLGWIAFWMVGTDLGVFTQWLASPGSLFFVNIPIFPQALEQFVLKHSAFNLNLVVPAFRSVYAATLVLCAILILRRKDKAIISE